ncbi:MAG: DUF3047 domain-containing protein [Pseudomonadota bacterium]
MFRFFRCTYRITGTAAAALAALCIGYLAAADQRIDLFNGANLSDWQPKEFTGQTQYSLVSADGRPALLARSRASASGLYREIDIDLTQTPYLHWSWRIDNILGGHDETAKSGDDYPARVYVVVSGGVFFWRTRAVNYVWSSNRPVGSTWPNAYTGNAKMIAVRSGGGELGLWREERRNVRDDLRRLFGEDITRINAVAVMTDSDDTGGAATAYYGDLYFSAR